MQYEERFILPNKKGWKFYIMFCKLFCLLILCYRFLNAGYILDLFSLDGNWLKELNEGFGKNLEDQWAETSFKCLPLSEAENDGFIVIKTVWIWHKSISETIYIFFKGFWWCAYYTMKKIDCSKIIEIISELTLLTCIKMETRLEEFLCRQSQLDVLTDLNLARFINISTIELGLFLVNLYCLSCLCYCNRISEIG